MGIQNQQLAERIIAYRKRRKLTQQKLSDRLDVSRATIASWETGRAVPSEDQFCRLADILEVELNLLKPREFQLSERVVRIRDACLNELPHLVNKLRDRLLESTFRTALPLEALDQDANEDFKGFIQKHVAPEFENGIVLFSEEDDLEPLVIRKKGKGKKDQIDFACDHYVVLDPIDRTTEAVRSIAGFSHFSVCSFVDGPLFSIVCLLFDPYIMFYFAVKGQGAFIRTRNSKTITLSPSTEESLSGAHIGAYVGKPSRLVGISQCENFLARLKEESVFVNVSGSYGFVLPASGQIDGFFEIRKGYRWHDILSGSHILKEAGGVVVDLDFEELVDPFSSRFFIITEETVEDVKDWYFSEHNSNIPPKVLEALDGQASLAEQKKEECYRNYEEILQYLDYLSINNEDEKDCIEKLKVPILNNSYELGKLREKMKKRQRFVSAGNYKLAAQMCVELTKDKDNLPLKEWDKKLQNADEEKTGRMPFEESRDE